MAKYNKTQTDLLRRLSKVSGKQLQELSQRTSLISYQRGYTKHGLEKVIRSTKNRNVLKALSDTVSLYERYGTVGGATTILDDVIATTQDAKIRQFISIQRSKGWDDSEILIAIDNSYDTILYMTSDDMMRLDSAQELADFDEAFNWQYGDLDEATRDIMLSQEVQGSMRGRK